MLALFFKSHVKGYVKRDGTFVRPHEDSRQAALFDSAGAPTEAAMPRVLLFSDHGVSKLSNNPPMETTGGSMQAPITMAALGEKYAPGLELLLAAIAKPGPIIKARYAELRERIGRLYDQAARVELSVPYLALPHDQRPRWYDDIYYNGSYLQSRKKLLAQAKARAGDPLADRAAAFLSEWGPIVEALDARKADVTTATAVRGEAKAEAAKAREAARPAKHRDAMGKLAAAIDATKPELASDYRSWAMTSFTNAVSRYGADLEGLTDNEKKIPFKAREAVREQVRAVADWDGAAKAYVINQARLEAAAQRYADDVATAWKDKIDGKLESLDDAEVHRLTGASFTISGTRGGRQIRIEQNRIVNQSAMGTLFNQFPARIYVDGKFMSEAAYKRAFA